VRHKLAERIDTAGGRPDDYEPIVLPLWHHSCSLRNSAQPYSGARPMLVGGHSAVRKPGEIVSRHREIPWRS
jgi:hypothetical protein